MTKEMIDSLIKREGGGKDYRKSLDWWLDFLGVIGKSKKRFPGSRSCWRDLGKEEGKRRGESKRIWEERRKTEAEFCSRQQFPAGQQEKGKTKAARLCSSLHRIPPRPGGKPLSLVGQGSAYIGKALQRGGCRGSRDGIPS